MESPQTYTVRLEPAWPRPHNAPEYPCIMCGKRTTFRYESIPICPRCAQEKSL